MKNITTYIIAIFMIATLASCRKPYSPPAIKSVTGYLVVEGVINPGNDSTKFRLSRTTKLSSTTAAPVPDAQVTIEGADNTIYSLTGNMAGVYTAAPLNLNYSQKYRLHIKTADGKEYLSDYVDVKTTPPIDKIGYSVKRDGLQISVDTHDPNNNTHYYRWDYVETWEFHSKYQSGFVSNGDIVVPRDFDQDVYYCYTNDISHNISTGSSVKLTQDVISAAPIEFIPSTSEKLEINYSIMVYQYAITNEAFTFWDNLKKSTENLGSIFDPQPTEITGNIHCTTNPAEPVIGFVGASTIQSKRIFISNAALPSTWVATYPYDCELDSVFVFIKEGNHYVNQEDELFNFHKGGGSLIPVQVIKSPKNGDGHTGSSPLCVDCTLRGTTKKPDFWNE